MQDHVHSCQAAGGGVLLLAVERHRPTRLGGHLEQQRSRAAKWIADRGVGRDCFAVDLQHLGLYTTYFGRSKELALAFAAFHGKVAHQVFVGIAQDVVVVGPVACEVERRCLEDCDQVGEAIDQLLTAAQLGLVVEVGKVA